MFIMLYSLKLFVFLFSMLYVKDKGSKDSPDLADSKCFIRKTRCPSKVPRRIPCLSSEKTPPSIQVGTCVPCAWTPTCSASACHDRWVGGSAVSAKQ